MDKFLPLILEFKKDIYDSGLFDSNITETHKIFLDEISFLLIPGTVGIETENKSAADIENETKKFTSKFDNSNFIAYSFLLLFAKLSTLSREELTAELEMIIDTESKSLESLVQSNSFEDAIKDIYKLEYKKDDYFKTFFNLNLAKVQKDMLIYLQGKTL